MIKYNSLDNTDCLRASISSIIEIDLIDFPNLQKNRKWVSILENYMENKGYEINFYSKLNDNQLNNYHLAIYLNPYIENQYHCVVEKNGSIIHNPAENDSYHYSELSVNYYGTIIKKI